MVRCRRKELTYVGLLPHNLLIFRYLKAVLRRVADIRLLDQNELSASIIPSLYIIDQESASGDLEHYVQGMKSNPDHPRILVLGKEISQDGAWKLFEWGVHGFVCHAEAETQLKEAIRTVRAGRLWFPAELLDYFDAGRKLETGGNTRFTSRERRVIELLSRRLSNKEIAYSLQITERTVRFHLSNIFSKLGVHDRYSAVEQTRSGLRFVHSSSTTT